MANQRLLVLAALLTAGPAALGTEALPPGNDDVEAWQRSVLFSPTPSQRAREHAGRVYLYSGLTDRDVERAMSLHFERIENMMFVRTRLTGPDGRLLQDEHGEEIVEDDGCD